MGKALCRVRYCALATFIAILLAALGSPASAQMEEMQSLEKRVQELFQAGSYGEALAEAERLAKLAEAFEAAKGKPGPLTAHTQAKVSWYALFAHAPEKALAASQRALQIQPDNLVPATNRAHALLFLNRIDEARAAYVAHKGEIVARGGKWEAELAKDFAEFRQRGLTHPQLAEMEKALAGATDSAKAVEYKLEYDEQTKLLKQVPLLHMAGKDAEALPLAERLVALSEKAWGKENTITANNLGTLADVLAGTGRFAEAEAAYKRSVAIMEKNGTPIDLQFLPHQLLQLGQLYYAQRRYREAEPPLKRALAMRRVQGQQDPKQVGIILNALGKLYADWGLFAEAEPIFNRALEMMEKLHGRDSMEAAAVLNNLTQVYSEQGRYADAGKGMLRAIAIYENNRGLLASLLGGSNPVGPMLGNLAEIYVAQGRYAEAEVLFKRALAIGEKDRDKANLALALNNLAGLYSAQGRFGDAETLLKRSLDTIEKLPGGNHPYAATLLNNLGDLYSKLGRQTEAKALLERSLALREAVLGPDHPDVALALGNLAVQNYEMQRYQEAEPLMKRALAIREKALPANHPMIAASLGNLAEIYSELHRPAEAEPLYSQALAMREKALGPNHAGTAESLHNLAGFYQKQGRFEEAAQAYKRSLAIWENALGTDHPLVATSLNNTAELYFKQQDWAQAARYWQRSTDILIRRSKRGVTGSVAAQAGGGASEIDQESNRFRRMARVSYRAAGALPAEAKEIGARMFEAAQWAQGSAAAQSLAQMAARKASGQGALANLIREQQDLAAEWQAKDKLLMTARSQTPDKRDARVEDELRARLAAIDARLAGIAGTLAKDFPSYADFASPEPLTLAGAQSLLKDNEALLLFLDVPEKAPLPEETFIWVVTKTDSRWVRAAIGTPTLEREVKALRCGLDFEGSWGEGSLCPDLVGQNYTEADRGKGKPLPFDASRAHALYKALFAKVEDMIKGKRLLIAASGPLSQLPFQVLVTKAPAEGHAMDKLSWLVREHSLTVLPAVSSLKALRRDAKASRSGKPYFGIGNPLLDGMDREDAALAQEARGKQICPKKPAPAAHHKSMHRRGTRQVFMQGGHVDAGLIRAQAPLPETADELCAVAGSLKAEDGSVLLGAEASETKLKALSERGELVSYGILHFATHGALAGQIGKGSEPGLLLTPPETASDLDDGYLSASEIVNLKLDAGWVILSACNTAAGGKDNSEALSGLARSFFYAGARSMLVSHWAVNSVATVRLVTGAMAAMKANASAGRAEALQEAMLALIAKGVPPEYWAPFVVAGEGGR